MKSVFYSSVIIACMMLIASCTEEGITEPDSNLSGEPIIQLIKLEGDLGKANNSNTSIIDFGEISATTSQYFLLLNKGGRAAFDINLSSNEILVSPSHIDMIAGENSDNMESIPIIKFTAIHVLPPAGVGELEAFKLGTLSDTINLSYKYLSLQGDTSTINQSYPSDAIRMGSSISLFVDSVDVAIGADYRTYEFDWGTGEPYTAFWFDNWQFSDAVTVVLENNGNVPVNLALYQPPVYVPGVDFNSPIAEFVIYPDSTLNITDYNQKEFTHYTGLYYSPRMRLTAGGYIIKLFDRIYLGGIVQMEGYVLNEG